MRATFILFLSGVLSIYCEDLPLPRVKISDGYVQGSFGQSFGGKKFIKFLGIPYAQPPIGKLRFEEPVPVEAWIGTWLANNASTCIQIMHNSNPEGGTTEGVEDCLHLNVYIPGNTIQKNNLDVIVHIHGGAFMFGSGNCYSGPDYLMDRDVILITLNYRVGIFGFLSTEDEVIPGNLGMKDQVMALKWVKENIKYFGGNPNSVTITGLSAGGASVHYHLLSPLSKGFYNKAISTSGCALDPWTLQKNALDKAKIIGKAVGCKYKNSKEYLKCLKSRPAEQIVESTRLLRSWLFNPFSPLSLVVDKWSKTPFLPEHPYKLLVDGKVDDVPWLASVTTSEGLYPAIDFAKEKILTYLNRKWDDLAPAILHFSETVPKKTQAEISQDIKTHYLDEAPISWNTYKDLVQLIGDRLFVSGMEAAAKLQSKAMKSPAYLYQFDYTGESMESLQSFLGFEEKYGVSHGDDMMFVFSNLHKGGLTTKDQKMMDLFLDLWANFARSGEVNLEQWVPVSKNSRDEIRYLYIGSPDNIKMKTAKELGHRSFWERLPIQENAKLFKNIKVEL